MNENAAVDHHLWRRGKKFRVLVHGAPVLAGSTPASAAVYGRPGDDCLVRIHSRCVYAEIFESDDCDCRAQLKASIDMIDGEGAGVVVYLDQEGRDAGLLAKAHAYRYSLEHGTDTFASYKALGLRDDARSYDDAADLLQQLGLNSIRLLTNNPAKIEGVKNRGIEAKRESLVVQVPRTAWGYLEAKRQHGHYLPKMSKTPFS